MTTPKEALELKPCPFCGGEAESDSQRGYRNISTGNPENAAAIYCTKCSADMTWCYRDTPEIERDQVMTLLIEQWNTRALASLQGEDAVGRVASGTVSVDLLQNERNVSDMLRAQAHSYRARIADLEAKIAIQTTTGLVPDEAAVRADEREKCERRVEELDCLYVNDVRYPFGGTPADPESSIRRETIKECLAAIRSGDASK